ncbi:MAG TPA: NAD(P)H-dependent oxidoreductase [Clostridiales bacterium]|jgi:NAD(P)H-dependent FMN reductase|nr:NAD(P)H-dependent oxidoreductase [Clostridiales bacterium]
MQVVVILGSISEESNNKKLAHYILNRYKDLMDMHLMTLNDLPMYNEDLESSLPEIVKEYKNIIRSSDGVIIVTPEYNHSIPGVLKNAIDWFSRGKRAMVRKPVMIAGASTGMLGTARAQMHLRQILNSGGVSAIALPGNEVFINNVSDKFDADGNLIHQPTISFLDQVVSNFIEWAKKINS